MTFLHAQGPATQPTAEVAKEGPAAPVAATVSPEAKAELDALDAAYNQLTSLDLNGTINVNMDIQGQTSKDTAAFTGSYQAPNLFRHSIKDDLVVGSTGEKSYLYSPSDKAYLQNDAPRTKADFSKSKNEISGALSQQNHSLLLALSDVPTRSLLDGATDVSKAPDVKVDDKSYAAVSIKKADQDLRLLIDPQTHLLRQVRMDLSKRAKADGAQDVKSALVTFDYTTTTPNAPVKPEQFAWTPPVGAKDMATVEKELMADKEGAAKVGKAAPDFSLPGMDDKKVSLAEQKGSVVVLDFWATWCGPCVAGLPHLDKIYQEKKEAGLKVFAVDQDEEKEVVAAFIEKKKLGIPVLLDAGGKIGRLYGVSGIPHQVVIGKDGLVKKVTVGFSMKEVAELKKVIEKEMAAK